MTVNCMKRTLPLVIVTAMVAMLAGAGGAQAKPIKLVPSSRFGWQVDTITKGNVCTVASGDECQPAVGSGEPGGFSFPQSVAVNNDPTKASPHYGHVYVTDRGNSRVQELTGTGQFVSMFGWDVNRTKVLEGTPQAERNVCTAASGNTCQAGVEGTAAGQLAHPESVSVDPATGDVYVQEGGANMRVEQYTPDGKFVWMVGKEVDATTKGNICTAASKDACQAGARSSEPGGFNTEGDGDLLAVDASGVVYVGDEHRVQEFEADGKHKGEIRTPLESLSTAPQSDVRALAVDGAGDLYLAYDIHVESHELDNVVREFDTEGKEVKSFEVTPRRQGTKVFVNGLALDGEGLLAVSAIEEEHGALGSVYEAGSGHLVTRFQPGPIEGIAFSDEGDLYGVAPFGSAHEVVAYEPLPVAELVTGAAECKASTAAESSVLFACTLNGVANPEGVAGTEVFFEWGLGLSCGFGSNTALQGLAAVEAPLPVSAVIQVRPHGAFCYRLAGFDQNVKPPEEPLTAENASVNTEIVAPRVVGEPTASFVTATSAVLFGQLNPENTNTSYQFQYGACETLDACSGLAETTPVQSAAYGKIGTTAEATGLQSNTTYRYRLMARNENGQAAGNDKGEPQLPEGTFTTALAPVPQAATGSPSGVGVTSAILSGTVNPDGLPATYAFELGIDNGAATQYGVVSSGSAGSGTVSVEKTLAATGLQPGTTYAYRIRVASGYGQATGETVTFTTAGLPSVLTVPAVLAQLPVPNIAFPEEPAAKVTPRKLTRAQQLARTLKACAKKPKSRRAACRRAAHGKYAVKASSRKQGR